MPIVFISYSHKDEKWKERVVSHLGVLQKEGLLDVWDDRRIVAGTDWEPEIEAALKSARVAILLVSDHFLNSDFILTKEVPALLQRRISDGLHVVPVILSACPWQKVSWLSPIQSRPKDGKALASFVGDKRNQELSKIAIEVSDLLEGKVSARHSSSVTASVVLLPPEKLSIARLPQLLTRDLFGRDNELQLLDDAWANPATNIVVFAAFGGTGKSALVNNWVRQIAQEKYRGAARVYAWSFWSQGSDQPQTSADPFIDAALRWFDDPDPTAGSPWDKGERLARYIKQTRTLLILDGLEPLQHPPGPMEGQLKEQTMQALLRELAAGQPGLCVISTREPIADVLDYAAPAVISHDLDQLSPQAGAQILREQKIEGDDAELEQASVDFGNHALALTILSSLLKDAYGGDIRRRREIPALSREDDRKGRHALRVMASYEKWLSEAGEHSMLAVLRILGLFNRPADAASIAALRAAPAIPGLTDSLQALSEAQWQQTLAKLRRIKMLAERPAQASRGAEEELDAHALVREHFGQQLREQLPDAWQAANNRLYEHLTRTAKEFPETVEEMAPLFAAVAHGCAAGRHQEALDDVYRQRIQRGNEFFTLKKLGAFGADLAALAGFFAAPWHEPQAGLTEADQAFVLNTAGFNLRALGRLKEAAQPMRASLEMYISQEEWKYAALIAGNLSELYLTLGEVAQARELAQQSAELADRGGDSFWRTHTRVRLADALHQAGRLAEAEATFREAEALQKEQQSAYPLLYSLSGFQYCDLLLGQGRLREVRDHAAQTLEWVTTQNWLLDIALDNLSLGRASLRLATGAGERAEAADFLHRAVNGLRQAGTIHNLPWGLLARAEMYRLMGDSLNLGRAQTDLAEAQRIAERGAMGLHLCDCHLEWARLNLAQGDPTLAREHWATAKAMIERMGYHRRDKDVEEIAQQLA